MVFESKVFEVLGLVIRFVVYGLGWSFEALFKRKQTSGTGKSCVRE